MYGIISRRHFRCCNGRSRRQWARRATTGLIVAALLSGFTAAASAAAAQPVEPTYGVTARIAVAEPGAVAVDSATGTVYVGTQTGAVDVIDATTNTVSATVIVGSNVAGLATNPVTDRVYVVEGESDNLAVIDGATNAVIATIPVGQLPDDVAVDPVTNRVYVANDVSNTVSVINGVTNTVIATIAVGPRAGSGLANLDAVAVNSATNTMYVDNPYVDPPDLAVIDGATDTVVGTLPGVGAIAVDELTNRVYTGDGPSQMDVIDAATGSTIATVDLGPSSALYSLAVDPDADTIFAGSANMNVGTPSPLVPVTLVDGSTDAVTATIDAGDEPDSIAVDMMTHAVYVGNRPANTVTVLTPGPGLWFSQPIDITADATSPSGATVMFPLPTATDSDGASLTVACRPHSGSIFPIGTTTVRCSVRDPNVANSPITHVFTVTVKGAAAQLEDLLPSVQGVGPGNVLAGRVQAALADLASGRTAAACGSITAFLDEVQPWSGRLISTVKAQSLTAAAERIAAVLAC